jgi:hypothetical protein
MGIEMSDPFSVSYVEARAKFRAAADQAKAGMEVYTAPMRGPRDEILACDVAGIKLKGAERVLILQSATHGVEGYCGSACQTHLLNAGIGDTLSPGLGIMMIHAINPYGFVQDRRVTEGNIDLNRNFVDFAVKPPRNADYDALSDAIAPKSLDEETMQAANAALKAFGAARGEPMLQSAITRGQYDHADGLYYGGTKATWSRLTFEGIIQRLPPTAHMVSFIDLHTGLGPSGIGELISEEPVNAPAYARARAMFGASVKSTVSGESVSAQLTGTIDGSLGWLLRDKTVTALALEFGTVPSNVVFAALRADNWLYLQTEVDAAIRAEIKTKIRAAFYVETAEWKSAVLARAAEVVGQAIAGLT